MKMKRQIFKKTLIAFLAMLFLAATTVALLQFLPKQLNAKAEEPVMAGQTAEYSIESDFLYTSSGVVSENYVGRPKEYTWDQNTWYSKAVLTESGAYAVSHMTIKPTQEGIVKFQFKSTNVGSNNTYYFRVWKNDEIESYIKEVTGRQSAYDTVEERLTTEDVLHIECALSGCDRWLIQGLNIPSGQMPVEVNVAETDKDNGTVTANGQISVDGKLTASAEFNQSIKLEAKPNDGFFAYWLDETGKVMCRENTLTIDSVLRARTLTVHFGQIGSKGEKISYDDSQAANGFSWNAQDGKYEIANPELTKSCSAATQTSLFIDVDVKGKAILSFDYLLHRAANENHTYLVKNGVLNARNVYNKDVLSRTEGIPSNWTCVYAKLDGTNAASTTITGLTVQARGQDNLDAQGEHNTSVVSLNDYTIGLARTEAANSEDVQVLPIEILIDSSGHHTIEIRFQTGVYTTEKDDEKPDKTGEKFYIKNIEFEEKTARQFTLKYDEKLGDITTEGMGISEGEPCEGGKTFTLYDDFPVTLTATAKKSVESSLNTTKKVAAHFINWTADTQSSETTTCSLKFEDGTLYFDGTALSGKEISALFEEEVIAPTVWAKINDSSTGGDDPKQITSQKTELSVDFATAKEKSLFVLFGGYGEGDTIELTVNGQNEHAMEVSKNGDLGPVSGVLTEDMKPSFVTDTVNWWLAQQLGNQYEIKITISKKGYFGTAETVIYVVYTGEAIAAEVPDNLPDGAIFAKDYTGKKDVTSAFNHLFTAESEAGAYFYTTSANAWSLTSEFDGGETKTPVFEGKYDQSKHSTMYPKGLNPANWYGSTLAVRNYYYTGTSFADYQYFNYQGVLTFDIYLEVTKGAGGAKRDAVILVERRDAYNSGDAPTPLTGTNVVEEDIGNYSDGQASNRDMIGLLDHKANVSIWTGDSGGVNSFVTELGDGWYRCVIPTVRESTYPSNIQKDLVAVDGKYVHKTSEFDITFAFQEGVDGRYAIRNVSFRNGTEADFKYSVNDATYNDNVKAQAGEELTLNDSNTLGFGSTVTLTATVPDGKKFYGWEVLSKDGKSSYLASTAVSTDGKTYTLRYTLIDPVEIKAWFGTEDQYSARYGGAFYDTLDSALKAATTGGDIYLIRNTTITGKLTISKNVRVIIPFDDTGSFMGSAATGYKTQQRISWASEDLERQYRYLQITLDQNATVEIFGGLYLGGVVNYADQGYEGHTSGAYSELILKQGSQIIVKDGGIFDVYGRVWGGKDAKEMGSITAESGGKVYEPFLILDFSGGSITLDLFMAQITPFKRYAMINIECPMTIKYGAQLIGHATLYVAQFKEFYSLDQPFISDDKNGETMIMLKDGGSVTMTYNPQKVVDGTNFSNCTELIGQTKLVFNGGARFSYMQFSALGLTVPTFGVYFSIPYNFDIELNGEKAQYETVTDFMIMPGATVKVGEGATLTLHANAWVYGGFYAPANAGGDSYPTATQLEAAGYSASGHLIVDGTLKIDKKWALDDDGRPTSADAKAATFLGIVETNGATGRIEIAADAILHGIIKDGTDNCKNYFAYTTTARVWDAAHTCFGNLVAGHTYTATSGAGFELTELNYTTTEGGQETTKLDLNQTMHGSWMIVHAHHQYDWTLKEDEQNFGSEKTKDITRECTELGCTQKETRTLIKVETGLNIGDLVYDGENVTAEELIALFKKYYGEKVNGFNFSAEFTAQKNHGDWDVTITIGTDNVYFYTTGNTADLKEFAFKYTITPAKIDGLELNAERAYNGTKLSNDEVIKAVKSGSLTLSTNDYDVEIINNSADAGEYTVKVTGKNNFEGEQQATYTIKAVDITIKVNSGTATYAGKKTAPEINATHAQTGEFVGGDGFKSVTVVVKEVPGEWSAKTYELTVKYELNETTNKGNYKITVDDAGAILTVNKAQVTLTVKGKNASYNSKGGYDVAWELDGVDGFLGEYEAAEALKMLTITCDVNTNNTVGNHDINAVLNAEYAWSGGVAGELENFTVTCKGGTYNISPVGYGNLSFGGEKSVTYDGKDHELTLTVDDESVTVTIYYKLNTADDGDYKQDKPVNVGTYNVKAVLQSENYNDGDEFTFTTGGELVINPATIDGLTLTATSKKYDKQAIVPAELVESVTAGSLTLQKGDYDVKVDKDTVTVGDYTITVTGKGNYTGQKTATYKIEKKDITVTVYDQEKDYDNNSATLTQSGENVLKIADLCPDDDLGITLGLGTNASKKDKGDYPIIPAIGGTVVANNYNITFKNGTGETFTLTDETHVNYPMYHIKAIKATVTIDDVTDKIYGDEVVTSFTHKTSGFIPGDSYTPTINYTCTLEEKPAANETGYDITGKVTNPNGNYEIEVKPGKYIIKQRPITVTINDQSSDYKHDHSYPFNANDWTTEDELAYDDDNAALQITLNHGELTDAGAYDITGSCANTNYKVTFKGSKEETKGVYTVNKLDISAEAIFWLTSEQGKDWTQDNDGYRVKYTGTPLSFTGHATYTQGDDDIELQVTINPETVQGEGETSVTMTISDKNYAGSKTVTLVVTDADGYTARLREALASLEGLAEGMDSEAFKEEDFGKLKQMQQIISTLDEKEREVAQSAIEGYEQLIDDWNSLADADSIIVAAETIADAPINGLFEAAAVTMALISLAYIAIKGGLL